MKKKPTSERISTGVRNLDALLGGGLPKGTATVIAGPPGSGKTTLAQQICFHNASPGCRVLYLSTLSEPTAKTLRYLDQFNFFDADKLDAGIQFVDLGAISRSKDLEEASRLIMEHLKRVNPALVVIDSFKVFDDLARSREDLRKFGYRLAVQLMAWEATTLLLGEYAASETANNPLFSIVDGLILVTQREQSGEQQRFVQIVKMRGTQHSRDEHPFTIAPSGIEVFAPRVTIQREDRGPEPARCKFGNDKLDELLGEGIPRGSSLLIAGVAGTGKTVLLLEFLYRGAVAGEKGIIFSFEETEERLRAAATGMGWDLDAQVERGMLEIVFIAQPEIQVEMHLLMMQERIEAMGARRVGIDSVSVFLHKVKDPQVAREKVFQLASIVQNAQAVGFFATDIPYGSSQISRFGVEETVVDGVILLTSSEEGLERHRYVEVYKLRNTAHLKGRHAITIGHGGITVFPRYQLDDEGVTSPPPLEVSRRLSTGVSGLDALLGGGVIERSVTLLSGSSGIGKSTLGLQFLAEGAARSERGLYIALEEGPAQLLVSADGLGLPVRAAVDAGLVEFAYLTGVHVRASQFLAILADRIEKQGTRRLVLDGVSHISAEGMASDELRQLLQALVTRFKVLGVTSLFTLESPSLVAADSATDRGFSNIADNIVLMRYAPRRGELVPTLTVVKTRSSPHDRATYGVSIAEGGMRIDARVAEAPPGEAT